MTKRVAKVSVSSSAPSASTAVRERPTSSSDSRSAAASSEASAALTVPPGKAIWPRWVPTPLDERHEHGCPDERPRVDDPPLTRREPLPGARHELVEGHHDMKKPPSTLSAWPVTPADSGSARNTAAWAISSASIMRRCGTRRL